MNSEQSEYNLFSNEESEYTLFTNEESSRRSCSDLLFNNVNIVWGNGSNIKTSDNFVYSFYSSTSASKQS